MVKSELIKELNKLYPNIFHKDLEKVVDVIFNEMANNLASGLRCELRNFGIFKTKKRKAYLARNPKTGEKIQIQEKNATAFKMSKEIKMHINETKEE